MSTTGNPEEGRACGRKAAVPAAGWEQSRRCSERPCLGQGAAPTKGCSSTWEEGTQPSPRHALAKELKGAQGRTELTQGTARELPR